jgi:hypothetical protein
MKVWGPREKLTGRGLFLCESLQTGALNCEGEETPGSQSVHTGVERRADAGSPMPTIKHGTGG